MSFDANTDTFLFQFPCTVLSTLVSYQAGSEEEDLPIKNVRDVTFDPDALNILDLDTVRNGARARIAPQMLNSVFIVQIAPIPLGADSEKFTQRYLLGKALLDAGKGKKQIIAEEKAEQDATRKDITEHAPNFQQYRKSLSDSLEALKRGDFKTAADIVTQALDRARKLLGRDDF